LLVITTLPGRSIDSTFSQPSDGIAAAHIPYRVPADDELPERLRGVLRVVYLVFNEGYAATEGDQLVRGSCARRRSGSASCCVG
jgi:predicted RNA polymerase sigma factor